MEMKNLDKDVLLYAMEIARTILSWKLGRDDLLDALDISDELADELLEKIEIYLNEDSCGAILKSGNNKGCQCPKIKNESGFCPRHEKIYCPKVTKVT